jgi:hypothetical protein
VSLTKSIYCIGASILCIYTAGSQCCSAPWHYVMCTARVSSLLRKSRLLHVAMCDSADSEWQVCIHTSAHQYCHFEDYHTSYRPIVGTAVTRHLLAEHLTLHIAAVGTAWSLLGSPRNGQAALHLFSKTFTVLGVHL